METKKNGTKVEDKVLTVEDLKKIRGGARGTVGHVRAGGRGSINGRPVEFGVDEL